MEGPALNITGFAAALGLGLLIGSERERNKGQGPDRQVAGVRTFTLASLAGAVSLTIGEVALIAMGLTLGLLVVVGYQRTRGRDPGMTTEIALLTTFLLGAWAIRQPGMAAGVAVIVAILLAARTRMHDFVHNVLNDQELHDGLLLAAAALVILPLVPDRTIDPWNVINPRKLWTLAVMVMAINAAGYVAYRTLGARLGLAIAGFFSGFVSSTATIAAMGARAKTQPSLRNSAVAGAALSSVTTILKLFLVVGLTSMAVLRQLLLPLIASGIASLIYGALFTLRTARDGHSQADLQGRPFDPKEALLFVAIVGVTLLVSAWLTAWLGANGLLLASAFAGFADAHAPAVSAASVGASGNVTGQFAIIAILAAFTTNTISKVVVAFSLGDRSFAFAVLPGLLLMVVCAWGGLFANELLGMLGIGG